jgi:hypothetical protein
VADATRFPDGMKAVVDQLHSMGMMFGIYTDRGTSTCGGRSGSQRHEVIDSDTFAAWGVVSAHEWLHPVELNRPKLSLASCVRGHSLARSHATPLVPLLPLAPPRSPTVRRKDTNQYPAQSPSCFNHLLVHGL